jgi:hypothetical protein
VEELDRPLKTRVRQAPGAGESAERRRPSWRAVHSITSSARASKVSGTVRSTGRRLHRQVGRLLTLENAIDVAGRAPILVDGIGPMGN